MKKTYSDPSVQRFSVSLWGEEEEGSWKAQVLWGGGGELDRTGVVMCREVRWQRQEISHIVHKYIWATDSVAKTVITALPQWKWSSLYMYGDTHPTVLCVCIQCVCDSRWYFLHCWRLIDQSQLDLKCSLTIWTWIKLIHQPGGHWPIITSSAVFIDQSKTDLQRSLTNYRRIHCSHCQDLFLAWFAPQRSHTEFEQSICARFKNRNAIFGANLLTQAFLKLCIDTLRLSGFLLIKTLLFLLPVKPRLPTPTSRFPDN